METTTQSRPGVFMAAVICIMVVIIAAGCITGAWLLFDTKKKNLEREKEKLELTFKKEIDRLQEDISDLQEQNKVLIEEKEQIAKEAAEARTQYIFENQRLKQIIEEERKASK